MLGQRSILASCVALLGAQSALASPQPESPAVGPADPSTVVHASVIFHQPRLEEAETLLLEISNPQSDKFGQYLDRQALEELFAPSEESQRKVLEWLESAGIETKQARLRKASASIEFPATISQMEGLLKTEYQMSHDSRTGKRQLTSSAHIIPKGLEDHVHFVTVTAGAPVEPNKPNLKRRSQPSAVSPLALRDTHTPTDLRNCSLSWTPSCIRDLYGIPLGTEAAPNNSMGIFGYGDAYNQADLDNFWGKYVEFIPQGTAPTVNSINGATAPGPRVDGEQILDLQMAYPIVWPQEVVVFQTPYNNRGGIGNAFLDAVDAEYCTFDGGDDPVLDVTYPIFGGWQGPAMCGTYNVTNVVSISYAPDEKDLTPHYVQRQCTEWMKLALRGVTVLVASGDTGVQGGMGCMLGPGGVTSFSPLFPGSCPYVTAVGATQVDFNGSEAQEVAVYDPKHNFYSGGGFSNVNAQPAYQKEAVAKYFSAHDPKYPEGTYNKSGRAFPDVALLGANVTISDRMEIVVSGGTSAAAPLFGAMINRINDERLLAGKKPIGFLNQILYQHPEVFTDITVNNNPGCGTEGFQAAEGWDPVTGLGSPKFPALRDLLVNLP
ncbi:hypothetical protein JX266_007535 [Neoarthrinium moseri]|nr:hypothetical protein JX266_007535 [Neoarthrinium moseri]